MLPSKKSGNTGASQKIIIYVEQRGKANKKKKKKDRGIRHIKAYLAKRCSFNLVMMSCITRSKILVRKKG
jgi:hypothetical protein